MLLSKKILIFLILIMFFSVSGDPNDRSLRRVEADVLIPDRMNERIQKVECREPLQGFFP